MPSTLEDKVASTKRPAHDEADSENRKAPKTSHIPSSHVRPITSAISQAATALIMVREEFKARSDDLKALKGELAQRMIDARQQAANSTSPQPRLDRLRAEHRHIDENIFGAQRLASDCVNEVTVQKSKIWGLQHDHEVLEEEAMAIKDDIKKIAGDKRSDVGKLAEKMTLEGEVRALKSEI
ncbi:hypothetical protein DL766_002096 [Monosporascus sp. MC13-8B]|uniref:Uncharacterized protein n=1 Tax=Monosporascus cannonballus TaxID=155416 RepID=A0ABY0GWN7_9PEZI|nr:hypothetical protein DL762_008246 [Monosporascus cannonballus]RYO81693.1 hypothetical protein DL763_008507 [Monosporascus cannonballus]RYP36209.1 hypothetical protein DL766_002096 [Monosporascus sp. MC13-8B]